MSDPGFIHLRVHSEHSLLEGAVPLKALPKLCADHSMPAVAVTDTNNMFGALEFSTVARSSGIQPIHGCLLDIATPNGDADAAAAASGAPVVLLAQSQAGYANLLKLNSQLYLGTGDASWLVLEDLERFGEGLICLTGGPDGAMGRLLQEGRAAAAEELLQSLSSIFGDRLYVEIQRHPAEGTACAAKEAATEGSMIGLAYRHRIPLVATNDVHFPGPDMFEAHDALMCIAEGAYVDQTSGRRALTPEHYFKSRKEMAEVFKDLPEALESTVEIARRCAFGAEGRSPILPKFADNESAALKEQARTGLELRLEAAEPCAPKKDYEERLEYELAVIDEMGFAGYFLIVADFIKWAKKEGIPVGPGRGSGAGSLVAYALTITDLDPLRFNLLFERFLNPERVSMPDFDVDFCQDRRDEVIKYVQAKYGADRVAHIITFGGLQSKMAVRDMGRVLRVPRRQVDRIAKLIPSEGAKNATMREAIKKVPRLKDEGDSDPVVRKLFSHAEAVEGLLRNASTHAAGVVIGDRPLDELVPLYKDPGSEIPLTQFSMRWAEEAGLVKFDFLGLKTLTVIKNAVDLLRDGGVEIDIGNIPLDDEKTFELCRSASTVGVFQLEGTGMKDTLRMMQPTCIEDIVALVALYRPGPMENIPRYCAVKNGKERRASQHELIDHIVAETHGIIVYQEQVMQIAQAMAGYTLAGADLLRRAIGKKKKSEMDAERPKFLAGAERNGVSSAAASSVWDLMAKFAEYGFPKAHAAAYAVVSYQTAWLKANHPVEFMASVMKSDISDTGKLGAYAHEVRRLGIELVPSCVNRSEPGFAVSDGKIIYGLGALKNVGQGAVAAIADARRKGDFRDLLDFASRVDLKSVGKRTLELLACAGAFDCLDSNRHKVFVNLDALIAHSDTVFTERGSAQLSLFGDAKISLPSLVLQETDDWSARERLEREFAAFGFYMSGHPLDEFEDYLASRGVVGLADIAGRAGSSPMKARIAGTVKSVDRRTSASGNRYAFVELSDATGALEVMVYSDELEQIGDRLAPGADMLLEVEASAEDGGFRVRANDVRPLEPKPVAAPAGMRIYFDLEAVPSSVKSLLERERAHGVRGNMGTVLFRPLAKDVPAEAELEIPGEHLIGRKIQQAIASLSGVVKVESY